MKNKDSFNFFFATIPIILGWTLYKQFDFETRTFENPWLAALYALTMIFAIFTLIRNAQKQPD